MTEATKSINTIGSLANLLMTFQKPFSFLKISRLSPFFVLDASTQTLFKENFFLAMIEPPARVPNAEIVARDYVFVREEHQARLVECFRANVVKNLYDESGAIRKARTTMRWI